MSTQARQPDSHATETLAVFDFDGTITYCDTLFPFLRHSHGRFSFWWRLLTLLPLLARYSAHQVALTPAKEAVLRKYLADWPEERVREAAESFASGALPRLMNPEALDRLRWHQHHGHHVVIASASIAMYVDLWARAQGIEDVASTRLEVRDGRVTGRLDGVNCYGPEKVRRLQELVGATRGRDIVAYGDGKGDREMLSLARAPHYKPFRGRGFGLKRTARFLRALL